MESDDVNTFFSSSVFARFLRLRCRVLAKRYGLSNQDCEDAVMEGVRSVLASRYHEKVQDLTHASLVFSRAAEFAAIDLIRDKSRQAVLLTKYASIALSERESQATAIEAMWRNEYVRPLARRGMELAGLTDRELDALQLQLRGLTLAQIADQSGISVSAAYRAFGRAVEKLASVLRRGVR